MTITEREALNTDPDELQGLARQQLRQMAEHLRNVADALTVGTDDVGWTDMLEYAGWPDEVSTDLTSECDSLEAIAAAIKQHEQDRDDHRLRG